MRSTRVVLACAVILGLAGQAFSQSDTISFTARLTDDADKNVDETVSMDFELFSSASGGTALWSETHDSVVVTKGLFSVQLGSITSLSEELFASATHLQVTITTVVDEVPVAEILSPRFQLSTVPFAFIASSADDADMLGSEIPASYISTAGEGIEINGTDVSIADGGVTLAKLAQGGATAGQVLAWDDSSAGEWLPVTNVTSIIAGSGITLDPVSGIGAVTVRVTQNGIDANHIADGSIVTSLIADNAIISQHIGENQVGTSHLADGAVGQTKLAANAVTADKIVAAEVTAPKLAANAVTTAKILDGNVTEAKLATNAVTETKIAAGSVTEAKIADGAVSAAKLATDAVTEAKIADGAVSVAKLAAGSVWLTGGNDTTALVGGTTVAESSVSLNVGGRQALRIAIGAAGGWPLVGNWEWGPGIALGHHENVAGDYGCVVGGGSRNSASVDENVTVSGGADNTASGAASTISGGSSNTANGHYSAVGGGSDNTASGTASTIGGGSSNTTTGQYSAIGGGLHNAANSDYSFVGGGTGNTSSGNAAVVGGGSNNEAGEYSTVPGGIGNTASGSSSFAAGTLAKAVHDGSFVWSCSSSVPYITTAANQFFVRAVGEVADGRAVEFATNYNTTTGNPTAGVYLNRGSTSWQSLSDRNRKKDFEPLDYDEVLNKIAQMPVTKWRYDWQTEEDTHLIGPVAQDLVEFFYPGCNPTGISTQQADGVHFAAVKALEQRTRELTEENAELRARLERLEALLSPAAE